MVFPHPKTPAAYCVQLWPSTAPQLLRHAGSFSFAWITSIALVGTLWTWIIILISHAKYRAAVKEGRARSVSYKMPGAPVTNWVVVAFLLSVATMLGFNPGTRVALYVAPIWFGLLGIAYYARVFRKTT